MPRHSPRPTGGRRKTLLSLAPPPSVNPVDVDVPANLTTAERLAWEALAPAARAAGTLVPETVPGFRLLVETVVQRDQAWTVLAKEGLTIDTGLGLRVHPLSTHARQLGQRVESLMAKFALTAPGRRVERPKAAGPSKWAGIIAGVR